MLQGPICGFRQGKLWSLTKTRSTSEVASGFQWWPGMHTAPDHSRGTYADIMTCGAPQFSSTCVASIEKAYVCLSVCLPACLSVWLDPYLVRNPLHLVLPTLQRVASPSSCYRSCAETNLWRRPLQYLESRSSKFSLLLPTTRRAGHTPSYASTHRAVRSEASSSCGETGKDRLRRKPPGAPVHTHTHTHSHKS